MAGRKSGKVKTAKKKAPKKSARPAGVASAQAGGDELPAVDPGKAPETGS